MGRLGPVTELYSTCLLSRVVNSVWLRDYQGLFDYDSKEVRRTTLNINDNCTVFAEGEKRTIKQVATADKTEEVELLVYLDHEGRHLRGDKMPQLL